VTHQLLERVQLDGVFEINVVVAGDDIHVNIILTEFIQEYLAVVVQRFEIDSFTVIIVVTQM
jgi:hypothetical protein